MNARRHSRRGFTLLEVISAGVLGAILVLVVFGLMGALSRGDRAAQARSTDADAMLRVQTVMERVFQGLVMGDQSDALRAVQAGTMAATDSTPASTDVAAESITTNPQDQLPPPRPRFMLAIDGGVQPNEAWTMRAGNAAAPVQRLEVVLAKPPIPRGWAEGRMGALPAEEPPEAAAGLVRGVFELRPDDPALPTAADGGWTLWWRQLPIRPTSADMAAVDGGPGAGSISTPAALATGLSGVQWLAFKGGQRIATLSAVQMLDLPGYMEMQVRTLGGMHASWMFEIGFSVVPDTSSAAGGAGTTSTTPAAGEGGGT